MAGRPFPFPGLLSFEADQHRVFFGRADEVGQLAGMLRSAAEPALLVVGPSGCGKSSLVRAGLLPMLAREPEWLPLPVIVPGIDPVATLTRELATSARRSGLEWTVSQVREQLATEGLSSVADELLLAGSHRRLLFASGNTVTKPLTSIARATTLPVATTRSDPPAAVRRSSSFINSARPVDARNVTPSRSRTSSADRGTSHSTTPTSPSSTGAVTIQLSGHVDDEGVAPVLVPHP